MKCKDLSKCLWWVENHNLLHPLQCSSSNLFCSAVSLVSFLICSFYQNSISIVKRGYFTVVAESILMQLTEIICCGIFGKVDVPRISFIELDSPFACSGDDIINCPGLSFLSSSLRFRRQMQQSCNETSLI